MITNCAIFRTGLSSSLKTAMENFYLPAKLCCLTAFCCVIKVVIENGCFMNYWYMAINAGRRRGVCLETACNWTVDTTIILLFEIFRRDFNVAWAYAIPSGNTILLWIDERYVQLRNYYIEYHLLDVCKYCLTTYQIIV